MRTQRLLLLAICLFVSGAAGLIYEVVWSRYLALFVGSSGVAHLVILSTFMGGLAIGARLFGPRADAAKRPLLVYVGLEIGIALAGILYPVAFQPLRALFIHAAGALGGGGGAIAIAASVVAGASILPAAILMGGTTPVLLRGTGIGDNEIGRGIAAYYFINSLGAVFGALAAGLWLVPKLGLAESSRAAAGLNIIAAALSLAVMFMTSASKREKEGTADDASASEPLFSAKEIRAAAIVATISGFVSFIYEVAWIRLLSLVLGSATYAFPLMLGAFILGLSLGSLALAMRRREDGWFRVLGWSQLSIGISALLSLCFYEYLPLLANHIRMGVVQAPQNYPLYLTLLFTLCIGAMIVPTFCMGIALPAATRVVTKAAADSGRSVGRLFALNTMGTVVGAIVGGAILLPAFGIRHTIEGACVLSVLIGLWVLRASDAGNDKLRARTMISAVCFLLAGGLTYAVFSPELDQRLLTAGMYREKKRIPSLEAAIQGVQTREMLYYADGIDATIAVTANPPAEPGGDPVLALIINGKVDASSHHDMQTQLMVGHLPMMMHPDPQEVLVVGLGAGVTVGATLTGGVGHVDCIELIPEVVEAARFFSAYNGGAHTDPRFKIFVQDAKTYLLMAKKKYDLIINEPTNLWVSGVPGLFTKEHISAARKCLKDDGFYLQWLHTYEMQDKSLWPLISTFQEVFPYSTVFNVGGDMIFIGSPSPFEPDFARMEKYVSQHDVAKQLERFSMRGLLPILTMQVVAKTTTPGPLVPTREPVSDFYPRLDFECAEAFFLDATASSAALLDRRYDAPIRADLWINKWNPSKPLTELMFSDFASTIPRYLATYGNIEEAWLQLWLEKFPNSPEARLRRLREEASSGAATAEKLAAPEFAKSLEAAYMRASIHYMDYVRLRSFIHLPDQQPLRDAASHLASFNSADRAWALTIAGDCDMDAGQWKDALTKYESAIASWRPNEPALTPYVGVEALHLRIAEAHHQLGDIEASHRALERIPQSEVPPIVPTAREMLECRLANHPAP